MLESQSMFVSAAERIFREKAGLQGARTTRDESLWQTLEENGLPLALVPEQAGGVDLSVDEAFLLLRVSGRWAIPATLADTMVGNWALATAGLAPVESGRIAVIDPARGTLTLAEGRISGMAHGVAHADGATQLIGLAESEDGKVLVGINPRTCRLVAGQSLAFEPSHRVELASVVPAAQAPCRSPVSLLEMGAAARANQIAGALETMLDLAVDHAEQRVAFGRPIAKFQAVQHKLALLAEETAAAISAASSAAEALAGGGPEGERLLEVAAAKIRCGEAAERGAAIAHQIFGAIGFTAEHPLHRLTLNALAWRDDFGNESQWALKLGGHLLDAGADAFWPLLSSR
ncbi:acyl-CoA dehydrogenase family protein [Azospirillum endophyticum]